MKEIKLKRLKLTNFKGIRSFEMKFNDMTIIGGANATGKTTLFDAYTWLLFGKDSEDRKDFNIKTLYDDNKVIQKIDHEVEADIMNDGNIITLKRTYREKWTTRRGDPEPEMTGHETLYWWNDVPLQYVDYDNKIFNLFEMAQDGFKMITNPLHFNRIKWQDRREVLIKIAGEIPTPTKFKKLIESLGEKSLEEYRKELSAKKKKLRSELDMIPARIDEVQRSIPKEMDWDGLQQEVVMLAERIAEIDNEISDTNNVVEGLVKKSEDKINRIVKLKKFISDTDYEAHLQLQNQIRGKEYNILTLKNKIDLTEKEINDRTQAIQSLRLKITLKTGEIEGLRHRWTLINRSELIYDIGNFVCPTCHRELDPDTIEEKKAEMEKNFNADKAKKLAEISAAGKIISKEIAQIEQEIAGIYTDGFSTKLEEYRKQLAEAEAVKLEKAKLPDEYNKALKELAELERQDNNTFAPVNNTQLLLKRSGYQDRINVLNKSLGERDQIKSGKERLKELERQEKEFAQQLADLEKQEYQVQEYVKSKVDAIEGKINTMFQGGSDTIRFRLFDTQINGGITECCDTLINGVPWSDANHAAKINSGIHIINVLSKYFEIAAPVWIDNAEAINDILPTLSQRIDLYVTDEPTLNVSYGLQAETDEALQPVSGEGSDTELPFMS